MQGRRPALVPRVQRGQQLHHLAVPDLADDEPVRAHAQRLAHQVLGGDLPGALHVGRPGEQADELRMRGPQLRDVLDTDDALGVRHGTEQGGEQGALARSGGAGDEEREPCRHDRLQQRQARAVHHTQPSQAGQVVCGGPQHAQRQTGPRRRHRGQHRVQAHPSGRPAAGQPAVHTGPGVVDPASRREREALGQAAHRLLVGEPDAGPPQSLLTVGPHLVRPRHQDVGDTGGGEQGVQRTRTDELVAQRLHGGQPVEVAVDTVRLGAHRLRQPPGSGVRARVGQSRADPVDQLRPHRVPPPPSFGGRFRRRIRRRHPRDPPESPPTVRCGRHGGGFPSHHSAARTDGPGQTPEPVDGRNPVDNHGTNGGVRRHPGTPELRDSGTRGLRGSVTPANGRPPASRRGRGPRGPGRSVRRGPAARRSGDGTPRGRGHGPPRVPCAGARARPRPRRRRCPAR